MTQQNQQSNSLSPDELLRVAQQEEGIRTGRGKLKIFLGMCAGVGKTYTMLEEAQEKLKEGARIVIGVVNTHGRKETERLTEGLPRIPERKIEYHGIMMSEFDIEAVLKLKPDLVLIDELAHTNIPGSRHPKRWQDVVEILDAGIDVYSTLNIQHVESRKETVEKISKVSIHETVPDSLLERADSIELVDLPPDDLLQRLKEGKVYVPESAQIAQENFFKVDNLTALREIALRFTAEKVEHDLHDLYTAEGKRWTVTEKLMVAVGISPYGEELIRTTRKKAFELDAPWIAVYVDTGEPLSSTDQDRVRRNLNLASDLGAEVITIHDLDIANALSTVAQQKGVTQIIIGRTTKRYHIFHFFYESLAQRLEEKNKDIDILILRQNRLLFLYQRVFPSGFKKAKFVSALTSYGLTFVCVALLTLLGLTLQPFVGYKLIGFIFLLGILILSFFVGQGAIFFAALLSAISWGLFFISPVGMIALYDPTDIALVVAFFCVSAVIGILNSRLLKQQQFLRAREETLERLYDIERGMGDAKNIAELRSRLSTKLSTMFPGEFDVLSSDAQGNLILDSSLPLLRDEHESVIALWAFQHGKIAGYSTDTLPASQAIYFPIKHMKQVVGVLAFQPRQDHHISQDEIDFLKTVVSRLAIYIEKTTTSEERKDYDFTTQLEKLHSAIMHSVSRSMYKPIDKIFSIVDETLKGKIGEAEERQGLRRTEEAAHNLKSVIDNVLTISELESGSVPFHIATQRVKDLIESSVREIKLCIDHHDILIEAQENATIQCDFRLMKIALKNILINAMENSPKSTRVEIKVFQDSNQTMISVIDHGSGIPADVIPLIFQKFYQIPDKPAHGIGLGLAIVKSVVDLHGGKIDVKTYSNIGTNFTIAIPNK